MPVGKSFNSNAEEEPESPDYPKDPRFKARFGPRGTTTPLGPSQGDFLRLRAPNMYNLRADRFERGTESQYYSDWLAHRIFLIVPAQAIATKWLESFKEFPPRARAASFSIDQVVEKLMPKQ